MQVPIEGKRNIFIISSLPYVSNEPHLGNLIGCVLSADVFARYCHLQGYNALFICGTDEYGTTTVTKAMEEKCTQQICDKYFALHTDIHNWFNISFDEFGHTSTPQQTEICQAIFKKLMENNWVSENTIQQVCQSTPQVRDTNHLILELPLLKNKVEDYANKMSIAGCWSLNAIQTTYASLKEGLKPRCITRDLKWGVPVPHEKYKEKVFYVWDDAPIGYISITSCYTPDWEKWWRNPDNVELYQFMGKDNIRFHTIMFPSTILGTKENWTMMKNISVTEYLNYESGKFKSKRIGVFGNDAKQTDIPSEVWQYYLLINRPEVPDTLFTWADLQAKLNTELLNNLGNFINRVLSFIAKPSGKAYGSIIPDAPGAQSHILTKTLAAKVGDYVDQYVDAMEKVVNLKHGLKTGMSISSEGNPYLRVLKQLNMPPETQFSLCDENGDLEKARKPWLLLPANHKIGMPDPLFEELLLRKKFSGSQADRAVKARADVGKVAEQFKRTTISVA
ncbi:Methionyl/Leucyl tRNA synthetase [Dillenia turbinata]|uniref:methionine--tRNA ligase n=1 Tax=Dillenia turbinata TaxID=194707 RepID=A0AAN8VUW2_9MAGN